MGRAWIKNIEVRSLAEILKDPNTKLVDVRTPKEVSEAGIEGAENIPMDDVPDHLEEFRQMQGNIVVFCRSGARSERVMHYLKQNGIENVINGGGYGDIRAHRT